MREYITANVAEINIQELNRKGYQIIHIPFFVLHGHTRTKCLLDPKGKTIIDAALDGAETISIRNYLELL